MEDKTATAGKKLNWTALVGIACLVIGGYAGVLFGIGYASDTKDREWQAKINNAVYDAGTKSAEDTRAEYAVNWHNVRLTNKLIQLFLANEVESSRHHATQRASEIAALHKYAAFCELHKQWQWLTKPEKDIVLNMAPELPDGIREADGSSFTSIGGLRITSTDPAEAFEDFLSGSYEETDYMEGWSIFNGSTFGQPEVDYDNWLKKRGLRVPEPPEQPDHND